MPKDKKDKKKKVEESDDEVPASESEEEVRAKPVKKNMMAALMDSDDEDEDEPIKEEKKKDKKDKKEDKDKKDKKDKKEKKSKRVLPVCGEVVSVDAIPKKDKLRLCKVIKAEGEDPIVIVTNAPNVVAGGKYIIALPGLKTFNDIEVTEAKVGGVESFGMFLGPAEMGFDTDCLVEGQAIQLAGDAEVGKPAIDYDAVIDAWKARKAAEEKAQKKDAAPAEPKGKAKKGKPKKGGKDDDGEDLDAVFAEMGIEVKDQPEAAGKKKAKAKAKAGAKDGEDLDDVFAEMGIEVQEEPEAAGKKKAKAKAKAGAKEELAVDPAPAAAAEDAPAKPASPTNGKDDSPTAAADGDDDKLLDAKALANKKKKEKMKAKKAAVGGGGFFAGGDDEAKAEDKAASSEAAAAPAPAPKKGGKPVKESAVVKLAREEMERKRALAEEREAFEAEQRRLIEEEQRQIREEEERQRLEREKKRKAKEDKIARQKADGTYQTKKEKERAARAKQLREQFGFGGDDDEEEAKEEEEEAAEAPKKKPIATKKKKQPKREAQEEDAQPQQQDEAKAKEKQEEPIAKKKSEEKKVVEDDGPDWEEAAEKADEEEDEAGSDDDDSDSDSDSSSSSGSSSSFMGYRSPILVIMGHVDTGKTKLLDKIRKTNVQEGEAGGITQQIGATFFPDIALAEQTKKVDKDFDIEVPGVMVIDTPGHEAFNNLRVRGSSLCDMAILVIDIMHGIEPQTEESLELLKQRKCFFVIALNKVDKMYQWSSQPYTSIQDALNRQEQFVRDEFERRLQDITIQLNSRGLNVALYWENEDPGSTVSIVPTSALTGEGVPDLLFMALRSTQTIMPEKLEIQEELECTVIEVKNIEGLGTTIDVVLKNGTLREGDQIVVAGMNGPIVTTIRALLTPQPMKEMRVKNEYVKHAQINTSMGIKICAPGFEEAVAGCELQVVGPDDDLEDIKDDVQCSFDSILNDFEKQAAGVYVKASTLGSLEALLGFLQDMKIPVFDVGIGEVHKKDVKKACIMKEKKHPEFAVILAFDVAVNKEAKLQAAKEDVQIMTADIIYHLQEKFETYMAKIKESTKTQKVQEAVFPVILRIGKQYIFHKADPIILGCDVMGGQLRIGTPLCIPDKDNLVIGRVASIEKDKKPVKIARKSESVCVKIEQNNSQTHIAYGRHFDHTNDLYSHISRDSIDTLKAHFKEEMTKDDWQLVIGMKTIFKIT